jgi:hypothetical protein
VLVTNGNEFIDERLGQTTVVEVGEDHELTVGHYRLELLEEFLLPVRRYCPLVEMTHPKQGLSVSPESLFECGGPRVVPD